MAASIGEFLISGGLISPQQLDRGLSHQRTYGGRLGHSLCALGVITDDQLVGVLSRQLGVPSIDLTQFSPGADVLTLIPFDAARKHRVFPVSRIGRTLTMAMADPADVFAIDTVKFLTACRVEPLIASDAAIADAIARGYRPEREDAAARGEVLSTVEIAARSVEEMNGGEDDIEVIEQLEEINAESLARQGAEAPVVKLVNAVLVCAIQKGASDIHVEPYETELRVRYRVDGVLHHVMSPPLKMRDAITSRLKIMARLDIAEKRLPQDGRIKIRFADAGRSKGIDFRVSCLPTLFGEKLVLRLLDKETLMLDMTALGFEKASLARFEAAIGRPWGMVLVTGPTGSGKTSTLYSSIARLNTPGTNIVTAEDPVEFNLPGINQVQVRDGIGLSFATLLRSFLRQDPNVILVGEIRDAETAEIAVKAALTGHLVLSTLHTNDAPSTINRLMNMGVESFLVASSLNLICAQRLVRRICRHCTVDDPVAVQALTHAGFSDADRVMPKRGAGCEMCNGTGYRGRVGLYEVMAFSDAIRDRVLAHGSTAELRRMAVEEGMLTLRMSGLQKVRDGWTTLEEVVRETAT